MYIIKRGPLGLHMNAKESMPVTKDEREEITRWEGAVLGPSQNSYPDTKLHALKEIIKSKRRDRITTHDLGSASSNDSRKN